MEEMFTNPCKAIILSSQEPSLLVLDSISLTVIMTIVTPFIIGILLIVDCINFRFSSNNLTLTKYRTDYAIIYWIGYLCEPCCAPSLVHVRLLDPFLFSGNCFG